MDDAIKRILESVQADISAHSPGENYAVAYRAAELGYWTSIPAWIAALPRGIRVLDVGAAYGTLALFARRALDANVTVIDAIDFYHPEALFQKLGVKHIRRDIERDDITDLGDFDLIIFTEVLEHLNFKPDYALRKLHAALRRPGTLLLSTPDADSNWGRTTKYYGSLTDLPVPTSTSTWIDDHVWQFTRDEAESVLTSAGFLLRDITTSPGSMGCTHINIYAEVAPHS